MKIKAILCFVLMLSFLMAMLTACSKKEAASTSSDEWVVETITTVVDGENDKPLAGNSDSSSKKDTTTVSGNSNTSETSNEEEGGTELDEPEYEWCTEDMLKDSLLYKGDTTRLASKIKAALADKNHVTKIAALGDSITQGASVSKGPSHYANVFMNYWKKNISSSVTMNIQGVGATTSYFGVHWVDDVVLADKPDIIFIEYVNDPKEDMSTEWMDSLLRKCLAMDNKPAVILLEMAYRDSGNAQAQHAKPAKAYGVPMISWYNAIKVPLVTGKLQWSSVSGDEVHPNLKGHRMLGEMMWYFAKQVLPEASSAKEPAPFTAAPVTEDIYKNAKFLDNTKISPVSMSQFTNGSSGVTFKNGWSTTDGGEITFKITAKIIGIVSLKTQNGNNGKAEVYIDGKRISTISGTNTRYEQEYVECLKEYSTASEHTVTVKIIEGENGANDFQILGWLAS